MSAVETEAEILLVEDNANDVELILLVLHHEKSGHKVHIARDGEEALDYLFCRGEFANRSFADSPKVVLLDLKLPKVDGFEVLRQIKTDARTRSIPVAILTSSNEERDLVGTYSLGANSYVQKSPDFNRFRDTIRQLSIYWMGVNHAPPYNAFSRQ